MSAKLVSTFADKGCHVVSATDPHGRILGFLGRSRYYFFQVAPELYSRGWVVPVPDPLLFRKPDSSGNRTRDLWICSQELWPLDHRARLLYKNWKKYKRNDQLVIIHWTLTNNLFYTFISSCKTTSLNWSIIHYIVAYCLCAPKLNHLNFD
jgi:hypothetical protein